MKKAIVTGASSGLGKYIAIQLSKKNIKVIGVARNKKKLEILKKYIGSKYFDYVNFDLKKIDQIENITKNIIKKEKFIEILINNAGIYKQSSLYNTNVSEKTKSKATKSQADFVLENNKKNLETNINLARMILDKYPDFDPSWNDDVKKSWIDSLTKLYDSLK